MFWNFIYGEYLVLKQDFYFFISCFVFIVKHEYYNSNLLCERFATRQAQFGRRDKRRKDTWYVPLTIYEVQISAAIYISY
jgi:hypothetical protein